MLAWASKVRSSMMSALLLAITVFMWLSVALFPTEDAPYSDTFDSFIILSAVIEGIVSGTQRGLQ